MSRTVYYNTRGDEICDDDEFWERTEEEEIRDAGYDIPTRAQEELADIERRKEKAVDHPDYYKGNGIEVIDVIEAWNLDFCLGNTVKYIARCGKKSDKVVEDLKKAAWYLSREIERMERE